MDLVLYQNEVCQALDGLAGIIETTAAKKNALKLEWMTDAIKVATSAQTNMWEVPKGVYGAKKAVTATVLNGQTGGTVNDVEKEADNLQAYLGDAQTSVDAAAKAMSDKVWAGLLKAAKDAKPCANGAAEKKKITTVMVRFLLFSIIRRIYGHIFLNRLT
ncbi:hypothetical protein BDZ89DRAFT_504956 [Hymenopellis radicata]|nr:hypothetical protein BDZ89DRAFT_504956 [Hymenopellis radicata]